RHTQYHLAMPPPPRKSTLSTLSPFPFPPFPFPSLLRLTRSRIWLFLLCEARESNVLDTPNRDWRSHVPSKCPIRQLYGGNSTSGGSIVQADQLPLFFFPDDFHSEDLPAADLDLHLSITRKLVLRYQKRLNMQLAACRTCP